MAVGLNNAFFRLTGRGLAQFKPEKQLVAEGGKSVRGIDLAPWAERCFFKSVHDEEATGFKMMNFLAGPCGLRTYPEPEGSHPQWNDFLRAISEASLKGILLKGTLLCNWGRGPFGSGAHRKRLADAAEDLMERKSQDMNWMSEMGQLLGQDRCLGQDYHINPEEWVRVYAKIIVKARSKAWFGIRTSFSEMESSWTIFRETVEHMTKFAQLMKEAKTILTFFCSTVFCSLLLVLHMCPFLSVKCHLQSNVLK